MVNRVTVATLVLVLGSCVSPLYERATIKPGASVTAGFGVGTPYDGYSYSPSYFGPPDVALFQCLAGIGTLRAEFGIGRPDLNGELRSAFIIQVSYGTGKWLDEDPPGRAPIIYEAVIGAKARVREGTALLLRSGLPYLGDAMLIQDVGRHVTCCAGVGIRGLTAGLTGHVPLTRNVAIHPSLSATICPFGHDGWKMPPSLYAGIGLGVE